MPAIKIWLPLTVLVFLMLAPAPEANSQTRLLDNGIIRLGVDLNSGGAISYLSASGSYESVVNVYDLGRYIQQSYYSGPIPFIPAGSIQHPGYHGWGWNPVQAGEVYNHPSEVVEESCDGTTIFVKCIPKQWALYNVDSECTMETWITLEQNRVKVRNVLTNFRLDTTEYPGQQQELPAIYTVGSLHRLFSYTGDAPFTGGELTQINNSGPPWNYWNSTEHWSALVDDNDWGLGVFHSGTYQTVGGFHGTPGVGGPSSINTGYMAPLHTDILDHNITYQFEYTLILGDLFDDIRAYAYSQAPAPGPHLVFREDRRHCLPGNLTDSAPLFEGFWPLILDRNDPMIFLPPGQWYAEDVPAVLIRAAYRTEAASGELFFANEDGVFSGDKRLVVPIIPDGEIRTYAVDLSSHPLYNGIITRLRFDPIGGQTPGDAVDLYSISTTALTNLPDSLNPVPDFVLDSNFPNPFNPHTEIRYHLTRPSRVDLRIYNAAGRIVRVLLAGTEVSAGAQSVFWDGRNDTGRNVASGAYFYKLGVNGSTATGKMSLVR